MTKNKALKMALEALEWNMAYLPTSHDDDGTTMAIEAVAAIKEALAQPQHEVNQIMLQALKIADVKLVELEHYFSGGDDEIYVEGAILTVRAAIAKAGKQS